MYRRKAWPLERAGRRAAPAHARLPASGALASFAAKASDYVTRNSVASLCLWPIPLVGLAMALAFWQHSAPLQIAAAAFAIVYTLAYRRLARSGSGLARSAGQDRASGGRAGGAERGRKDESLPHTRVLVTMG